MTREKMEEGITEIKFGAGSTSSTVTSDEVPAQPFSWAETLLQPEDPFFSSRIKELTETGRLVEVQQPPHQTALPRSEPGHKDRFDALFEEAVKPKK
jgi:hypothetical protein